MSSTQLSFFTSPQEKLQDAIRVLQNKGLPHANYITFVRSLAIALKSSNRGATVVGGCASGITTDEVIGGLGKVLKEFELENNRTPAPFQFIRFNAPCCYTRRQFEEELASLYATAMGSFLFGHRTKPRYEPDISGDLLDPNEVPSVHSRTPIGRLVALLKVKSPSAVVITDAENLGWSDASSDEVLTTWKLIRDIARRSGVPHLVFAPISTVRKVIDADEALKSSVRVEVLQPYTETNPKSAISASYFRCVAALGGSLPWSEDDTLPKHLKDIDRLTCGDIARLRRWIIRAASLALSDRATTEVSWSHFDRTQPNEDEMKQAQRDREGALKFCGSLLPLKEPEKPSFKQESREEDLNPGVRKLGRDKCPVVSPA